MRNAINKIRIAPSVLKIDHLRTSRWSLKVISPLDIQIVFYILDSVAELSDSFTYALHQLRNFLATEKQQNNQSDNDDFASADIAQHN